eukprot:TRINITY_DN5197_c0_g2_i3.p1 TRINITY_DN5197_c0_g2~~TRINITY_DN5197_c0_g2_i3.p1  ORF type:complete len:109 (+),score=9.25 TRINITY_DN5197_c0_g2_i3:204-530(+)
MPSITGPSHGFTSTLKTPIPLCGIRLFTSSLSISANCTLTAHEYSSLSPRAFSSIPSNKPSTNSPITPGFVLLPSNVCLFPDPEDPMERMPRLTPWRATGTKQRRDEL